MRAQRVREGESRMEMQAAKWTAEGAVNSHYFESAQYSATWGIRQLPGICRYSAKCTSHFVNQGGTAGEVYCSSLTEEIFVMDGLFTLQEITR